MIRACGKQRASMRVTSTAHAARFQNLPLEQNDGLWRKRKTFRRGPMPQIQAHAACLRLRRRSRGVVAGSRRYRRYVKAELHNRARAFANQRRVADRGNDKEPHFGL